MTAPPLLEGRVALVTGASAGLGEAIVETLTSAGAQGVMFDLTEPLPRPGWMPHRGDVRDPDTLRTAVAVALDGFGRLDVVVANAGIVPPWRATGDLDFEEWDDVFGVNVRGVVATIAAAVPGLRRSGGGSVIAMASVNGWRAHSLQCLYTATKHAVVGIVRATALDLGRYGIRVNALAPGPVATDALIGRMRARQPEPGGVETQLREAANAAALGRLATAQEVARAALFLASDLSAGVTGQTVPVDAGLP